MTVQAGTTTTVDVTLEEVPTTGTLEGTVTGEDGTPIANATVTVGDRETMTDADGSFALELEAGDYTVTASAEGYEDASRNVTVEVGATTTVDITLEAANGTVEGIVTDADGDPIANATVTAEESGTNAAAAADHQTTTDANGTYSLELEPGEYTLTVSAAGYQNASQNVTVVADSTTTVDVTLRPEDEESVPVSEVVESVNANEIASANDAIASFNSRLQQKAGRFGVDVENVSTVDEVEAETVSEAHAEADRLRTDADEREAAIFNRTVTVINEIGVADIDPAEVQSPADARQVADRLEEQGGLAERAAQSLRDAADLVENDIEPPLHSAADKLDALGEQPALGTVEGTVNDESGEPIANATVTVGDQQTTTDANGTYSLELEPGEYTLRASAEGYENATRNVTVEANATTTVDVTLTEEPVAPEPDADVIVDANVDEERVAVGETVTVDVTIENATGGADTQFVHDDETEIGAYTLVLRYDSDALEFEGIDRPHWQVVDIADDGILVVDRAWVPPGQNEMPVDAFTAEFEVVDGAGDEATFEFDSTASSVEERVFLWKIRPLDAAYDGASVAIEASDDGGTEAPSPAPEPTPEPNPNPNPVEYPDSISAIWDAIVGFGSELVGIDSSASPINDGHSVAAPR